MAITAVKHIKKKRRKCHTQTPVFSKIMDLWNELHFAVYLKQKSIWKVENKNIVYNYLKT